MKYSNIITRISDLQKALDFYFPFQTKEGKDYRTDAESMASMILRRAGSTGDLASIYGRQAHLVLVEANGIYKWVDSEPGSGEYYAAADEDAYWLNVLSVSGGGGSITADNGLTANTSTNVRLGGTLLSTTTINAGAFGLIVSGNSSGFVFEVDNIGSSHAIFGSSASGYGIAAQSINGKAFQAVILPSSTNSVATVAEIYRSSSGTSANGIGGSLDFIVKSDSGNLRLSNQLVSKFTSVTDASRISQFIITGVNNAITYDLFTLGGEGYMKMIGITASAASSLTPSAGMIVFVNSTDGTFTSVGFWGYDGSAWNKF